MTLRKAFSFLAGGILFLCGCSQVEVLNVTIPRSGYSVVKNISYQDRNRGQLDIYVPDNPAVGHPVVVFYYGGGWTKGSKDDYLFVGQAFASHGITTVIADYRIYPEVYFPDFMNDVAQAFVWTHKNIARYGGNPHNLFVAGHSAGAYNAVMLALNRDYLRAAGGDNRWIRGVIGVAGPYDFLPLTDPVLINLFSKGDISKSQPINYVRQHAPPMLLVTGDEDEDVLPRNSYLLAKKLSKFGNSVTVKTYPGVAHIGIALAFADGFRNRAPVLNDSMTFLMALVKPD